MAEILLSDVIQQDLPDKHMNKLVEDIRNMGCLIVVEYNFTTDKRLFRGAYKIEWFQIYHQIDLRGTSCFQRVNLPTNGNGITYQICMAYLYGLYNGLYHNGQGKQNGA